ncbi:MAG: efflux RND transporter periplasmic adaptor subunit [Isosphaeraceae bacterium]|jgi:RND family efflux transporter MFP subunit
MRSQQIGIAFLTLAGLALGGDETGSTRNSPQAGGILLKHCTLEYKKTSLLGANQMGVLEECRVAPGDRVKAGQVLGHLLDEEFRAELDARATQAASDIAIRVAQARHRLALSKLERTQKLINRNFASVEELSIQSQEEEAERLSIEDARQNKKLAELQRKQSEATIRSREIRSPHDGVVVEVLKVPGQSISGLDSVLRVVDPSELRVTGYLDVTDAWRVWPGQAVKIWADISGAELEIETEAFTGQVEYVDLLISPESRTCKVTAIVPNRAERLRSGLEARMEINLGGPGGNPPKPLR